MIESTEAIPMTQHPDSFQVRSADGTPIAVGTAGAAHRTDPEYGSAIIADFVA